jgi:CRISPR-associated protein Cmr5
MPETTSTTGPTLDQRRAKHAWEAVKRAKLKSGAHAKQDPKKFGGQAKKLPTRIMAAGLGQALAFLRAKDYAPGLLAELADWVLLKRNNRDGQPGDLLQQVVEGDSNFLRRATDETLAYLQWLNRFVEAEGLAEGE